MKVGPMNLKTSKTLNSPDKPHSVSERPGSKQIGSFEAAATVKNAEAGRAWQRQLRRNPKLKALEEDAKRLADA